jgi:hypothetical protein
MGTFISLLPLLLWSSLFVILLKKFGFNKIIFFICLGFTVLLNIRAAIMTETFSAYLFINIIGQTLFLYVIISFVYNLIKRKKEPKLPMGK